MTAPARVGRAAFLLGFAGLLPQLAACGILALAGPGQNDIGNAILRGVGLTIATVYPAIILSFLGGMWWGFAMRREAGQAGLVALAVLPSLAAAALLMTGLFGVGTRTVLIGLALALVATLPVDRRLAASGEAPANWMRLRVPLSLGLGGLTLIAAALAP